VAPFIAKHGEGGANQPSSHPAASTGELTAPVTANTAARTANFNFLLMFVFLFWKPKKRVVGYPTA
jgi:hypothetical protein